MLKKKYIIILAVIGCLTPGILFFLNDIYIEIRFLELKNYLKEIDKKEISIDHISLISRYILNKKVYDGQISVEKADNIKFNIQSMLSSTPSAQSNGILKNRLLAVPVLFIININRFLLNKSVIKEIREKDEKNFELDLAYYYERNNMFQKALESYDRVLTQISPGSYLTPGVLLHSGFCLALLGKYQSAKEKYGLIIQKYSGENITITASILLHYLELFHIENQKVQEMQKDSISKSIKLFRLFSFEKALKILEKMEPVSSRWEKPKIQYFKAKCYSGLGKPEKAIHVYLKIISANPNSKYAKFANRRIFDIGQKTGNDEVRKLAQSLNNYYNDEIINNFLERKSLFPDHRKWEVPRSYIKIDKNFLVKINKIQKKKQFISYKGKKLKVYTIDGNIFKGKLMKNAANYIKIITIFGEVKVNRSHIKRLEMIE